LRILLAYDGSTGAEQARDLLAHLDLPQGSAITVASVLRPRSALFELDSIPEDPAEAERHIIGDLESELEIAARGLVAEGRTVERRVLRGRPAEAILAEASLLDADLIVMGSRGHGPFKSILLGSVSTEVVNASSRPVLVARGTSARRVLLATDGTDTSALALDTVVSWPIFTDAEIKTVSVSEPASAWIGMDPAGAASAYWLEIEAELADERRAAHAEMARAASEKLREAGRSATSEVRVGNPAHQIVEAAKEMEADLIVTGSRHSSSGFPGVIGSVARNVLQHATASVLVVREPATPAAERSPVEETVATGLAS
jgi:nucleotide-binding universal stress UspA family protein